MLTKDYTWALDPLGTSPNNLITGERHSLTVDSGNGFHFFIPKASPFFMKGVKVVHVATGRELFPYVDWAPAWEFTLATRRTLLPVYGAIVILDKTLNGTFEIQYQTLGGEYTLDEQTLLTMLLNTVLDPRVTSWESVVDKPLFFTPLEHIFNVDQMVGMDNVVEAIDRIRDSILSSIEMIYPALGVHIRNLENPHGTTAEQVGLGLVSNFPMATDEEAAAGLLRNRYMSPAATKLLLSQISSETVAGHASNYNNPHRVNKDQVELGLVDNFATATLEQTLQGTATNLFVTPAGCKALIEKLAVGDFSSHLSNKENPHETTKTQVGLGLVDNYATAVKADWDTGTAGNKFMTPGGVKYMIEKLIGSLFTAHVDDHNNPHQTNKTQLGLGAVQNFGIANSSELLEGVANDKYVVVSGVKAMIEKFANTSTSDHIADQNNPHGTTAEQVGLGLVQNYPIATAEEAIGGLATNCYMTPALVASAINVLLGQTVAAHTNDKENPHETTAEQVGLGLVSNYATATVQETLTGTANDLFTTPAGVRATVDSRLGSTETTSLLCGALAVNDETTGSAGWLQFATVSDAQNGYGVFLAHGLLASGEPLTVVADFGASWKLSVQNPSSDPIKARFGYVADEDNLYLYINPSASDLSLQFSRLSPQGKLVSGGLSDWLADEPVGIVYVEDYSQTYKLQRLVMNQGYDLAVGLTKAADIIGLVTPVTISEASLAAPAVAVNNGVVTATWSGSVTTPATPASRLVFGGVMAWPGTQLELKLDSAVVSAVTLTEPVKSFDLYDLAAGVTVAVDVSVSYPVGTRPADFTGGYVRAEQLNPA